MRKVIHGAVYFKSNIDKNRVLQLMKNFCSCKRSAYQAIHKQGLVDNGIKKYCKNNYMQLLNQRYISDAATLARGIINDRVLFGNKKLWEQFTQGKISKRKWQHIRNSQLYSRGDRAKNGNPNIRVTANKLLINDPEKRGLWLTGELWLQESIASDCYDVRIESKDDRFKVTVSYELVDAPIITNKKLGVVGVDCNPDGIAISELNYDGNLLKHFYLKDDKLRFARHNKRKNSIGEIAKNVIDFCLLKNKPLVLEKLKFSKKHGAKKFNRMAHNFIWKQLIEGIKSRALKNGVEIIEIPAAYTSIVGKLKYMDMYSIPIHNAAAIVIGRLGMEIKDKVVTNIFKDKDFVTLEGRTQSVTLKKKSFLWFKSKFKIYQKSSALTAPCLAPANNGHKTLASSTGEEIIESNNWSDSSQGKLIF